MSAEGSDAPYREGRVKMWVRKHFASKESRAGLPKSQSQRERWVVGAMCAVAGMFLLIMIGLTETGRVLWAQLPMVLALLWCGLAGLVETASDWQREILRWPIDSARDHDG